jgi:hypothetical protein
MAQILLLALAGVALPTIVRLALVFIELLVKLLVAGFVVGLAIYLIGALITHGLL